MNDDTDTRPMGALAQNALSVQTACNLSGVVHSFSRDIARLRVLLRERGDESTDIVNSHPICILYATQIAHLTGGYYKTDAYDRAYDFCDAHKTA